jgi:membrane protease YdiL (CAAX protease family)
VTLPPRDDADTGSQPATGPVGDEGPAGLGGADVPPAPPEIGVADDGRRLGWPELVTAAVAYVVIQLGAGLLLVSATGALPPAPVLLGVSAVSALGAVAIALGMRVRSRAALGLRRVTWRTVGLAVGLGVAVWLVSRVLIIVYISITGDQTDPQAGLTQFSGGLSAVLVVVLGGLVVPLGEELLFRGIGFGSLRRYGVVLATIVSSLLFALAHGLNVVFLAVLVLAVVNALLYERTRSVWPCFVAHATFNLCSFGVLLAVL